MCLCSLLKTLLLSSAIQPQSPWDVNQSILFSQQIIWDGGNNAVSCAFSGNDFMNSLTKPGQCVELCAATPDCTHYTWTDYNGGTCWMKTNKVSKSDAFVKHDQNAVCGIVMELDRQEAENQGVADEEIKWDHKNSATFCAFSGNDMINAPSKSEECGDLCAATPGCTHYTWTDFNSGTCWMKESVVIKSEAFRKIDQNAKCGLVYVTDSVLPNIDGAIVEQNTLQSDIVSDIESDTESDSNLESSLFSEWNSIPESDAELNSTALLRSGRSTRYWDCCKPSCSWNGKAHVTNPVNSCARNGFNVLDRNAQNGCGGGTAFTCNNNIPWAINDNLAYGFAAANIKRQSERDWCCKCYQLTFTSGPVAGKRMIVQVTNTGGDLADDHFDLQIPGGGVGIFNGCSSQWGAPSNGWGDRYGGVHSERECDQLPNQIRQGCKWRFQWFKGADNPNFNFVEVRCPNELTSKTGCVRL